MWRSWDIFIMAIANTYLAEHFLKYTTLIGISEMITISWEVMNLSNFNQDPLELKNKSISQNPYLPHVIYDCT